VDVWKSREQFDRFAREQIEPFTAEAGLTEPPETHFTEIHNHLTKS